MSGIIKKAYNSTKITKLEYFTYFPFVGWWFTVAFKRDNAFAMEHTKKALVLAAFFATTLAILGISFAFVSNHARILRMVLVISVYLLEFTYIILCIIGTKRICSKKDSGLSFLNRYTPDFL